MDTASKPQHFYIQAKEVCRHKSHGHKVTETRVFPNPIEDERLKAFATVTLNGCFVVTDMKVITETKVCSSPCLPADASAKSQNTT